MSVIERLAQFAENPDASPLESLGTLSEIIEAAPLAASSPYAPLTAQLLCAQLRNGPWTTEHTRLIVRFVESLDQQRGYLALRETTDILLENDQAIDIVGESLHDALFPDNLVIQEHPLLAGLRLSVVLAIVAKTEIAPYRLLGMLTSTTRDYPEEFSEPLARSLGIALDLFSGSEDRDRLIRRLAELMDWGCDEAEYQWSVAELHTALQQAEKDLVVQKISELRDKFNTLAGRAEARDDSESFAQACTALLAFDRGDKHALTMAAEAAMQIANRRALLGFRMHQRPAISSGHRAQLAWISLAWKLDIAAREIDEDSFLDTWVAIDAIGKIYEADREFSNLQAVAVLVQPRVVNGFAQRRSMLDQLKRAIKIDRDRDNQELSAEIYELLDLAQRAQKAQREPHDPTEGLAPVEPYLYALLGQDASAALDNVTTTRRQKLEEAAYQIFIGSLTGYHPSNSFIDELSMKLINKLGENASFVGQAKIEFSILVIFTIRFLVFVGDNAQSYTKVIHRDDPVPLESEIQNHFHQFLSTTELAGRIDKETSNIATGRADVVIHMDEGRRYVTEVKRELQDATKDHLNSMYLAQTFEYQSTNQPLGQLLVLDLTKHESGTPHVQDSIWVAHQRDNAGRVRNSAVVAVVRGNRPTPSAMR